MPKLSFPRSHLLFNSQNARATRLSPTCFLLGNMEVGTSLCLESLRTVMCKIRLFLIKGVVLADVYTEFLSSVLLAKKKNKKTTTPTPKSCEKSHEDVFAQTCSARYNPQKGRTHNLQKSSPTMPPLLRQVQRVFDSSLHQLVPLGLFIIN